MSSEKAAKIYHDTMKIRDAESERLLSEDAADAVYAFLDLYAPLVRPGGTLEAIVATEALGRCQAPMMDMIRALVAWREGRGS